MPNLRRLLLWSLVLLAAPVLGWLAFGERPPERVVLVILDTVRSDHLSACGYGKATSPTLAGLEGALSCDAYAPGSWTLPSHASFFTGLWPDQHGAHAITSGVDDLSGTGNRARPLNEEHPTLAEQMTQRGYVTALFSANPVVGDTMGLGRGFDHIRSARGFGHFHGEDFDAALEDFLEELPTGPLFLVINIADAHMPWASDWHPPFSELSGEPTYSKSDANSDWSRFVVGEHPDPEGLKARASETYDEAVWRADQNLGRALERLGCPSVDCRLVITSDHGEMLGEHGQLDHGHYLWEENQRVPLWTNAVDALPDPVSALEVYWLVLEGRLIGEPVQAMSWPHVRRCARTGGRAFCNTSAAWWGPDGKQLWIDGALYAGDELQPLTRPTIAILDLGDRVGADRGDGEVPPEVMELLKAAGYVD